MQLRDECGKITKSDRLQLRMNTMVLLQLVWRESSYKPRSNNSQGASRLTILASDRGGWKQERMWRCDVAQTSAFADLSTSSVTVSATMSCHCQYSASHSPAL
jgi:hypothetical protein